MIDIREPTRPLSPVAVLARLARASRRFVRKHLIDPVVVL